MTIDNKTLEMIEAYGLAEYRLGYSRTTEAKETHAKDVDTCKQALIDHLTARDGALHPPTNAEMTEAWGRMADGRARWNGEDLRGVSEFLRHRRYRLNHPAAPAQATAGEVE